MNEHTHNTDFRLLFDKAIFKEKKIELPVFFGSNSDQLWQKHHVEKNHPECDMMAANIEMEVVHMSNNMIHDGLLDCQICQHKTTTKKAAIGKSISAKGTWWL